tara:strand:- start:166 stop:852 length:687 start_codon:yes stop_codon:yes gene_type:complete
MDIIFDIGGTNFRFIIFKNNEVVSSHSNEVKSDVKKQIEDTLNQVTKNYDINYIKVSIAGIVEDYKIFGCNNIGLKDNTKLMKYYKDIKLVYLNDGDAFILGEVYFHKICIKGKNLLGLIFGTGVGCGVIINGYLVRNCEVHKYLEGYMKKNKLNESNIIEVSKFVANELSKLIELLNLDYIIINGYVNKFNQFESLILEHLSNNSYYNPKIIFSHFENSNIYGLLNF